MSLIAISSDPKLHNDFSLQVQASLAANTFAVTGHAENKQITELLPGILNQVTLSFITYSDSSKLNVVRKEIQKHNMILNAISVGC